MGDTSMIAALPMAIALSMLLQPIPSAVGAPGGEGALISPQASQVTVSCDAFAPAERGSGGAALVRDLTVNPGATFIVTLCQNASTGFSWDQPVFDHALFTALDHTATAPGEQLLGAAGIETWTFQSLAGGDGTILFTYSQPWSGGTKAAWTLKLNVHASAPAAASRSVPCGPQGDVAGFIHPDPLTLAVGQTFDLTLCANPSTGFSWKQVDLTGGQLQTVAHETAVSETGLLGAPGSETWTFKAVSSGTHDLVFWYLRTWEGSMQLGIVWLTVQVTD